MLSESFKFRLKFKLAQATPSIRNEAVNLFIVTWLMCTFALHRILAAEDYYSDEICLLGKQERYSMEIKEVAS